MDANYLILQNLILGLWLGVYLLFFSRSTFFRINRFMLLGGLLLATVLPFFPYHGHEVAGTGWQMGMISVRDVPAHAFPVSASPLQTHSYGWLWAVIVIIYWAGVATMTFLFFRNLVRLRAVIKKCPRRTYPDHIHVITRHPDEIFSFGRYLFAPAEPEDAIYRHELAHIRQRHTLDNLLVEILKIVSWINPLVYQYHRVLKDVHEYQADAITTESGDKQAYAHLLVSRLLGVSSMPLVHSFFNRSLIQKRLIMLSRKSSSAKMVWEYLFLVPVMAALIIAGLSSFTLRDKLNQFAGPLNAAQVFLPGFAHHVSQVPGLPVSLKGLIRNQQGTPLSGVSVIVMGTRSGTMTNAKGQFTLKNIPAQSRLEISMVGYSRIDMILPSNVHQLTLVMYQSSESLDPITVVGYADHPLPVRQPPTDTVASPGKVFTFVEQMPSFPGGKEALNKFLKDHIRYPVQARHLHLEGDVTVSFVVDRDGNISQVNTITPPLGGGLDEEAVRVIRLMPPWKPGMQNGEKVEVAYSLPIHFALQ